MSKKYTNLNMFHTSGLYSADTASLKSLNLSAKAYVPTITDEQTTLPVIILLADWGQNLSQYEKTCNYLSSFGYLVINLTTSQTILFNQYEYAASLTKLVELLDSLSFGPQQITADTAHIALVGHGIGMGAISLALNELVTLATGIRGVIGLFPTQVSKQISLNPPVTKLPLLVLDNAKELDAFNSSAVKLVEAWGENATLRVSKKIRSSALPEHASWRKLITLGSPKKRTQEIVQSFILGFSDYYLKNIKAAKNFADLKFLTKTTVIDNLSAYQNADLKDQIKQLF